MAKARSFADKVARSSKEHDKHCDTCGEVFTTVKMVASERSEKSDAWKFNQKFISVCKCNVEDLTK